MKRIGGLFDSIHTASALSAAAYRAAKGKRERSEVAGFIDSLPERVAHVGSQLREGSYRFGSYQSFPIRDPKTRIIHAPSFQDRVVHHAIIAATGETFDRGAIHRSYACRAGLGQHFALNRAAQHVAHAECFLKVDIAKYYDSVDHDLLRRALQRRFRERRLLDLLDRLLDSYHSRPGRGLPIGALTSQYLGNFFLTPIDHWVHGHAKIRAYLRYMDDMLFFADHITLRRVRGDLERILGLYGLEIKQGGILNRCSLGVPWLGFTLYPDRVRLNPPGRRRLRRRWTDLVARARRGSIGEQELQDRCTALFAHARWADDRNWRRAMLEFSRTGEAQEVNRPRAARRLLEQSGQELPLGLPQQESGQQPQQEHRLPGLSASRHGGAQAPPDVAPSCAPLDDRAGDKSPGRIPPETDMRGADGSGQKAPGGVPPSGEVEG